MVFKRYAMLLLITLYLIAGISIFSKGGAVQAASVRQGDRGEVVRTIQTKLKNWGYYKGQVDSIFGSQTRAAVISFQAKNGLTQDGIVGPKTATAMGISLQGSNSNASANSGDGDVYMLARVIYGEARGEPYVGQVAVGAVVLNRVRSPEFPNSISGVAYQPGAFDVVADGQINLAPDETSLRAARDAMNGWDPTNGCLYYYNPRTATNKWMLSRPVHLAIGRHSFCL